MWRLGEPARPARPCRRPAAYRTGESGVPLCKKHATNSTNRVMLDRRSPYQRMTCQGVVARKPATKSRFCRTPVLHEDTGLCRTHTIEVLGARAAEAGYSATVEDMKKIATAIQKVYACESEN